MKHWSTQYLGLPYRDQGRDRAGIDCWGLPYLVYPEQLGISLPSYTEAYASVDELAEIDRAIAGAEDSETWLPVTGTARAFDLAVFRVGTYRRHVGIVVSPGMMLHAHEDCSKIEHYRAPKWEHRLTGIFRHFEMTSKVGS